MVSDADMHGSIIPSAGSMNAVVMLAGSTADTVSNSKHCGVQMLAKPYT
jgi:hypothetical protein